MSRRVASLVHQPPSSSLPTFSRIQKFTTLLDEMKQRVSFHILHSRKYSTRPNRRIITLDPTKLVQLHQTAIDVSNVGSAQVWTPGGWSRLNFGRKFQGPQTPFPSGTKGFLYYRSPSDRPRIAGQLRFRVTPSDDPTSFPHGHDLTLPHTRSYSPTPWSIPLLYVPDNKSYVGLLSHLVDEGLVEESLVESIRRVGPHHKSRYAVNYLFKLSDPFEFNYVNGTHMIFRAVTESGQGSLIFIFGHQYALRASIITFKSGRIKACFERSVLPEHEGKRVVVVRCLEVVEPLVMVSPKPHQTLNPLYLAAYTPIAGQLLHTSPGGPHTPETQPRPWSLDISDDSKHPSAAAFRLLW